MSHAFDDEEIDEEASEEGEDLGELTLDEVEDLQEDDVIGHRVVTTNDDGEDPFASGAYYDE